MRSFSVQGLKAPIRGESAFGAGGAADKEREVHLGQRLSAFEQQDEDEVAETQRIQATSVEVVKRLKIALKRWHTHVGENSTN